MKAPNVCFRRRYATRSGFTTDPWAEAHGYLQCLAPRGRNRAEWPEYHESGQDLAEEARQYFIPDFSNWKNHDAFEQAFDRLLRDLEAEETRPKAH
ncbi:MAG TPA: hypothetical protein VFT34_07200 [Verrucomicrobiae bacterium]|nr:hypothetical protein [Verrucomicrobiae bacterium]